MNQCNGDVMLILKKKVFHLPNYFAINDIHYTLYSRRKQYWITQNQNKFGYTIKFFLFNIVIAILDPSLLLFIYLSLSQIKPFAYNFLNIFFTFFFLLTISLSLCIVRKTFCYRIWERERGTTIVVRAIHKGRSIKKEAKNWCLKWSREE